MSNIIQQNITPKSKKHGHQKKVLKIAIVLGVIAIVILGGYLTWQWWPKQQKQADKPQQTHAEYQAKSDKAYIDQLSDVPMSAQDGVKATQLKLVASAYLSKSKFEEAKSASEEVLKLSGYRKDPIALLSLADAQKGLGEKADEKKTIEMLIDYYKDHPEIDSAELQTELSLRAAQ